jgi:hydroxyethylthiazole kinase-like uncharacterized protein yjeF
MEVEYTAPRETDGRLPALKEDAHKGDAGRVLIVAGSKDMPGAAILCARAALRGGAGLVTMACLDPVLAQIAPIAVPEAVLWNLSSSADESGTVASPARALEQLASNIQDGLEPRRFDAIVVGPGLGNTERTAWVMQAILEFWHGPLVVDADGLNAIADQMGKERQPLVDALRSRGERASCTILTPHPGEAQRLLKGECGATDAARLQAAESIAKDLCSIVCLKGAGTVVTDGQQAALNPTGNPGMATAGSGDVLAGLTAAYLTQVAGDFTAYRAARAAVFVHGHAGDMAAKDLGQRGIVASDLGEYLSRAEQAAPWT